MKMARTVARVRAAVHKAALPYSPWPTWKRKLAYGFTERQVRRRLAPITFCGYRVFVHKKVVGNLYNVERQILDWERSHNYEAWQPDRIDCFNWRVIRGGTTLSRHSWAIALDIDPKGNPSYPRYTIKNTMTIPAYVVQAFLDHGWLSGAISWNQPNDTMHFQRK